MEDHEASTSWQGQEGAPELRYDSYSSLIAAMNCADVLETP